MLEAAREAMAFSQGRDRDDLDQSRLLTYALVRCLEIIGEAAACVSQDSKDYLPLLPWPQIVGMRNRLIHAYFEVDTDMVWRTVSEDLPLLISWLDEIMGQQPSD
jgi:uncharacterized protein with HEPN domain